jgi:TPR repeat protein
MAKQMAVKYYSISSSGGNAIGSFWLGLFYHWGFGIKEDLDKAIIFLNEAAKQGHGQAMY